MRGFTSSLNLSVASALVLQKVFDWFPGWVGDMDDAERNALRDAWRPLIAKSDAAKVSHGPWLDAPERIPLGDAATGASVSCGSWAPRRFQQLEEAEAQSRHTLLDLRK